MSPTSECGERGNTGATTWQNRKCCEKATAGIKRLMAYGGESGSPQHVGFGSEQKPYFWLGRGEPIEGYVHVAFAAKDRRSVDDFYEAAVAAGGRDNGRPGLRPHYHPGYYGSARGDEG